MTGPIYKHFQKGDKIWPVVKSTGQVVRSSPITVTKDKFYVVNGNDIAGNTRIFPRHHFEFKIKDEDGRLVFEDRRAVEMSFNEVGDQGANELQGDQKPPEGTSKGVDV